MKKPVLQIISITIFFAFIFIACDKTNDPSRPYEDVEAHPVIWEHKYNQHQTYSNTLPAMDENGNIFFAIQDGETVKTVYVFAIDKDGNALWDKEYSAPQQCEISRIMVQDGKIYYYVSYTDDLYYITNTIFCLNATDGSEVWQYTADFEYMERITSIAITSDYVIVGARWGDTNADAAELHFFNLSGSLVKSISPANHNDVQFISTVGQDLYLGANYYGEKSYSQPSVIKMNIETNVIDWEFHPEYQDDVSYIFEQSSLAIDHHHHVYCIIRPAFGTAAHDLYVINADGSQANKISSMEGNPETFDILIDADNNAYVALDGFTKYSPDGNVVWEFHSDNSVPNGNFLTGGLLADNDIFYHAEDGGLLNVDDSGEPFWAQYDQSGFSYPGYPILNADGDIVVVGDMNVICFKGDGASIQDAPWPRVFCNYGNTSSK